MNKQKVWTWITVGLSIVLLLAGCAPRFRVGELQSESQTVELGEAGPVRVEINFGAGKLDVTGGAKELLEADFTYNVDRLKPEVEYSDGRLIVQQPGNEGLPALQGITGFRNEWDLQLNSAAPMALKIDMGAGTSDLQLGGLNLTGLVISLGATDSTIDLSGDWASDLKAGIEAGAADITVRLPKDVGVHIQVEPGPHTIETTGLTKDGNVYTNAAYGASGVTLDIHLEVGVGRVILEVAD